MKIEEVHKREVALREKAIDEINNILVDAVKKKGITGSEPRAYAKEHLKKSLTKNHRDLIAIGEQWVSSNLLKK